MRSGRDRGAAVAVRGDDASRPLADRLRPRTLADVVGQGYLLAEDAPIRPDGRGATGCCGGSPAAARPPSPGFSRRRRTSRSNRCRRRSPVSRTCGRCSRRRSDDRRAGRARCCSSTRSTGSTGLSRTRSCPTSRPARSSSSAPPPKTPASSSTGRCCPAVRCSSSSVSTTPPSAPSSPAPRSCSVRRCRWMTMPGRRSSRWQTVTAATC